MGVNRLLASVIYLTYKCCNSADRYTNDIFNCTLKRHCVVFKKKFEVRLLIFRILTRL